jgi:TPR repeat protein
VKEQQRRGEALEERTQPANKGHATAQYNLGLMYQNNRDVFQSD